MKSFLAVVFLLLFITQVKYSKVRAFLFFLLSISCVSNLMISKDIPFESFDSILTLLLVVIFFCVLIFCLFPTVKLRNDFVVITHGKVNLSKIMVAMCVPMVIINFYILYKSYLFIISGDISMTAFKNDGYSGLLIASLFPSFLTPFIRVISLMGWFCLFLLVVNILKRKYVLSFLALFGSFNIPLMGLIAFSRSGIVYYLFSILILWIIFEKYMDKEFAGKVKKVFSVFFIVITIIFSLITYERFSEGYEYWWVYEQSGSNVNIVVFSIIYYFTSWIDNTIILLTETTPPIIGKFNGYFSLPYYLTGVLGIDIQSKGDIWFEYFGDYSTLFVGLFLDTLFDMGFFWIYLFFAVFNCISFYPKECSD